MKDSLKNDKDFAVFPNSFLKDLLIKDDIAYIGMSWIDRVENKYKPLSTTVVYMNTGKQGKVLSR